MVQPDVVILGGGAAGLFCAAVAGGRGRRVAVLEHMDEPGRKILISGGGRCNFTNLDVRPEHFLSENPDFSRSALARFTPSDFIELLGRHGTPYHEKKLGQLFCDGTAREVRELLLAECERAGVTVHVRTKISAVTLREGGGFKVLASIGEFPCESLVVATGGLSFEKLGASDLGYRIARQFGLAVVEPRPALVPFVWSRDDLEKFGDLTGLSAPAEVSCCGKTFREQILFTHKGLSGPAILQISSYWLPGEALQIRLLPELDLLDWLKAERLKGNRTEARNALAMLLPKRLVDRWFDLHQLPSKRLADSPDRELKAVEDAFQAWSVKPAGTEGHAKAEVTAGGVSTAELSSKTMEARRVKGLYFIGEVVDVTGWLGGYNFHWAWASAHAAGEVV
ncbi:MAG: NAD(P)/FAD-dependent oxidoreductase [Deltaproteobacteria bacterium]|nr:NAD(P)/FAD-dependent oxidoreductase [Deltaproteobacteria bacterium]